MLNLRCFRGGSGDVHPGSNIVFGARWTPEEADARIEQLLAYHREREIGFQWLVGPFDTPADLRERLERHGLVLAGDQAMMARVGLDDLDIPTNPHVTVEVLDGSDDEALEAVLQIVARCFNWTPQQVDERRPAFIENLKDPKLREKQIQYLARLDGTPVADARVFVQGSMAYLGGASTLPEYRNQKIYSTLLRRRLEDARERGYQIVVIHAEPMSRRVVSRYGFEEFARFYIYAWMPVIDMEVIRGLVPDE
jgi:predicted N-acetyltransferase YhbS